MEKLTIKEAAERCGISTDAIRKRVDRGTLESVKEGRVRLIPRAALEEAGLWPGSNGGEGAEPAADAEPEAAAAEPAAAEPAAADSGPTSEQIAQRAYEIHRDEGGDEVENWLRAERELREA
ncbi:MAG: excisionase family DNA-binding protein [Nocardioidaceae bacterium]